MMRPSATLLYLLGILLIEIWFEYRQQLVLMAQQARGVMKGVYGALSLFSKDVSPEAIAFDHKASKIITIIGIPFAWANLKMVPVALLPLGKVTAKLTTEPINAIQRTTFACSSRPKASKMTPNRIGVQMARLNKPIFYSPYLSQTNHVISKNTPRIMTKA